MTRRSPLRPGTLGPVVAAAAALACAEFVRSGVYAAYLPQAGPRELGLPQAAVGAAWTAHFAADTLMRGPAGALIARRGLRPVMLVGSLLSLIALALLPLAHWPWLIVLIAALHGVGFAAMWPGAMNLTADAAREGYQGRAITGVALGVMPLVGGGVLLMGGLAQGNSGLALLVALGMQTLGVLATLALPARRVRPREEGTAPAPQRVRRAARALAPLLPAAFMQNVTMSMLGLLLFTLAPGLGLTFWGMVALLAVGGVIAYASLPFTGRMADRGRARLALTAGFALVGLALSAISSTPPVWALYPLAALAGLGYACISPGWAALVTGTLPEGERPAAWGALMTFENAGTALGPLLGSLAFAQLGVPGPFLVGGVLALTTSAAYVVFRRAFPEGRRAQPA